MPETAKINHIPRTDLGFLALKPRQVLLALQQKQNQSSSMANQLTAERKTNLLHSVVLYLHRNGFSKTHKRFLKEAQIQSDCWKTSSFDLEDMYCKYLDTGNSGHSKVEGNKEQGQHEGKDVNNPGDTITKKKKKKNTEDKEDTILWKTEIDNAHAKSALNTDKVLKDHKLSESNVKSKPKEAGTVSVSLDLVDLKAEAPKEDVSGSVFDFKAEGSEKPKDKKKKKKNVLTSEPFVANENRSTLVSEGKRGTSEYLASQSCVKIVEEATTKREKKKKSKSNKLDTNVSVEEKLVMTDNQRASQTIENGDTHSKDSKKRKRKSHDGNENHKVEGEYIEGSKRRKTEEAKESKDVRQKGKSDEGVVNKDQIDNGIIVDDKKQGNGIPNGDLENSAREKSTQKQLNGSSEPRTINAFQRVKADEVEFVDDRLRDNSYWAKGGADSGYGAKAQEILGQVKGRDFRHEKTKKKRGSYRGGQIDLQSHSVKFNYSDED